jgi:beta-N-acetylhexosaminidase
MKTSTGWFSFLLTCVGLFFPVSVRALDVSAYVQAMPLESKIGQLMMVGVAGTSVNEDIRLWVAERKAGGIAFFSRNLQEYTQIASLLHGVKTLQAHTDVPLFLAVDQEGGTVVRVKEGMSPLPSAMALGATHSVLMAYLAGQTVGSDLKKLGFNMNFAPVLDVNSNPSNPVIGVRALGGDPKWVAELGKWFVRGQREMGVVSVVKHFPGHGDTRVDSHFATPVVSSNVQQLKERELVPFATSITEGADVVMTAHIALPWVTGEKGTPASLSKRVVQSLLREDMDFNGIVLTDGIEMQAVVQSYGEGAAAVKALQAGADMVMVLWSDKAKEDVYEALMQAVQKGVLSMARIDASLERIVRVKQAYGLLDEAPVSQETTPPLKGPAQPNPVHQALMRKVAQAAVTVLYDHPKVLPLGRVKTKALLLAPDTALSRTLSHLEGVHWVKLHRNASRKQRMKAVAELQRRLPRVQNLWVVAENTMPLTLVQPLKKKHPHVQVLVAGMGSPYEAYKGSWIDTYVCAYSALPVAQQAMAEILLGEQPAKGSLPVHVLPMQE